MYLGQYLAIGDLGDSDQKIAVIQEFVDRPVARRMTGRQVERPGGDGTIYPLPDARSCIGQNFGSFDNHALKPCFCIYSGFSGHFLQEAALAASSVLCCWAPVSFL